MIVMIDGPMISRFIENSEAFNRCADERFAVIVQNRCDKVKSGESTALDGEDCDDNRDAVDREKFRAELKAALVAAAEGIGKTPVNVLAEEESLMIQVYEEEIARIEKEKEEMMKMKMRNGNHERKYSGDGDEYEERENREIVGPQKMKKKSMRFLSFCACSGKFYGDDIDHP